MQPWDSAAIVPCIEEAGGVVTTLQGERKNVVFGGSLLTSCHSSLHEEILRLLRIENPVSNRASEMAA
jgi:histidinol-phosphatase